MALWIVKFADPQARDLGLCIAYIASFIFTRILVQPLVKPPGHLKD